MSIPVPFTPMQNTYFDELRKKLDTDILELRLRISSLSSQRNTLAPIAHLPPEVLSRIFVEFRNQAKGAGHKNSSDILTWICRDWREIAINYYALWSEIDFPHPPSVDLYLARSKKATLAISLSNISRNIPSIPVILQELDRIRSLSLSNDAQDNILEFPGSWGIAAPWLSALTLDGVSLPNHVFSGVNPRLRELTLTNCEVPWKAPLFSNLTALAISSPINAVRLDEFLFILRQSPHLTGLELEDVFELDTPPHYHTSESQIILPRLRYLSIPYEESQPIRHLLRHLTLPDTIQINISVSCFTENVAGPAEFLEAFYTSLFSSRSIPRLYLRSGFEDFTIQLFGLGIDAPNDGPAVVVHLRQPGTHPPDICALSSAHLDLSSLEYLTFNSENTCVVDWGLIFGGLPQLRRIEVQGFAASSFLNFLVDEGRNVATIRPDILARYLDAVESAITEQITFRDDDAPVLGTSGLRFHSLGHLTISLPYRSHSHSGLPEGHDKWFSFNLFSRRMCGIGLKKLVHINWIPVDAGALNVACHVVDEMPSQPTIQASWLQH